MSVDLVAMNPPERHDWHFPGPSLHWDTSLVPTVRFGVQGILCLNDTAANQGAFTTVPGFHKRIDDWLRSLPPDANPRQQDLLSMGTKSIPGQAGDMIIWQNAMPHGASPNRATRTRIVQFIDMYPQKREFADVWR
jgi:ectoine hydroxylase-related dioxygenase (phytanoyl-CoA dioxygenase family)